MLTSQVANCYPSLSQSTIFLFSLCFLCIFHFRYNDAKRRIRSSTTVRRTVWKHHCNKPVVLRCGKSLWTIPSFFLLLYFFSLFSYIKKGSRTFFDVFFSLPLVSLCRSTVMTITYSNLFNRKETEDERIRISEAIGCDWKTIRSRRVYSMNERDINLKRMKWWWRSNEEKKEIWIHMIDNLTRKKNKINLIGCMCWRSSTWANLTRL
jgi:hypothetical protein